VLRSAPPYGDRVMKPMGNKKMTNFRYRIGRDIEVAAHRARNREIARLARLAGSAIAGLAKRLVSAFSAERIRHA
jgi:hypothetical protein